MLMVSMSNYIRESIDNIVLKNLKADSKDWVEDIQGVLDIEVPEDDIIKTFDKLKNLFGKNLSKWIIGTGPESYGDTYNEYIAKVNAWAEPVAKKYGLDAKIVAAIGYVINGI